MKRKRRDDRTLKNSAGEKFSLFRRHPWVIYPLLTFAGLLFIGGISIAILSRDLPSLTELERAGDPLLVTRIYSVDGKILDELFQQKRIKVPLDRMPDHLIQATIASEDRKFFNHWGLDLRRIFALAFRNITTMEIHGGASTLTAQLAKKLYLTPKKSYLRKLREALTSLQIERTYSKPEILEMYLNQMPLGRGTYGVQAAARAYFQKNVEDLNIQESALIIGLLQLPYGYYHPDRDPDAAIRRRNIILQTMVSCGYLTQAEHDSLSTLELSVIDRDGRGKTIAPYFCEYVRVMMQNKYGMGLYKDGLSIYTTLDTRVQACADSAVRAFIPELETSIWQQMKQKRIFSPWFDPPLSNPREIQAFLADSAKVDSVFEAKATLQTALVALNPSNGHILAMIGGRDFNKWKYNRAVQAKRQPGSAFKPIAYTVAIDNDYPPTYELLNQPIVLIQSDGTRWSPPNYDGSTGGPTTLREALKRSLNMVAARLVKEVIPAKEVIAMAKHFGLTTTINPYDAIALGSDVVIPIELVSAYTVFPNRGVRVEPVAVLRVEDKDGNVLEEAIPRQHVVIPEETAYIMTDMMTETLKPPNGTGFSARWRYNFYYPAAAGKTGTTNDFRNAWFVGFTPHIAAGVWVGFDDERLTLGDGKSGAVVALPVWAPFMRMVHDSLQLPLVDFTMPSGVMRLKICAETKKIAMESCPQIWEEVFTSTTAPTDTCQIHQDPRKRRNARNRNIF
ncbi:MAG: PBP1A family penicillin-binding protein [bacterium]